MGHKENEESTIGTIRKYLWTLQGSRLVVCGLRIHCRIVFWGGFNTTMELTNTETVSPATKWKNNVSGIPHDDSRLEPFPRHLPGLPRTEGSVAQDRAQD